MLKNLFKKDHSFRLPTSPEDYDIMIATLCLTYGLKDPLHASAVCSVAIRHLPNDQSLVTSEYLYSCIVKSLANHVCNYKSQMAQHEAQVEMLVSKLEQDPYDQQARDELNKAAADGSKLAQLAVDKLEGPNPSPSTVVKFEKPESKTTSD